GPSPEILFAASSIRGAYRIDLKQNLMEQIVDTKKFEVPDTPTGISYDPEHQRLLITYRVKSSLAWQIWDESAGELHNNHAVADWDNSVGFVYNHTQGIIYTGNIQTNRVEGYDVHTGQLITRWPPMDEQIIPRSLLFDDQVLLARARFGDDNYSFDHGGVHFVALDSSVAFDPTHVPGEWARQTEFLESDLARADDEGTGRIVVFMHHPLFGEHPGEGDSSKAIPIERRRILLDLFHASGVSTVFAGHWHTNYYSSDGDLEMVITSAVGLSLGDDRRMKRFGGADRRSHEAD
ncbi:MAG: hypothetical protein IH899_20195, partial [Planctomycetes bacterium]|nr:hypothetical protein [Planctomycetota bacterium]